MANIGSSRRKSRHKLRKKVRNKGKISIKKYIQELKPGDRIYLKAEPSIQKGLYHTRFHGKTGIVKNKRGKCYEIIIKDMNKEKTLIVHPIHMKKA